MNDVPMTSPATSALMTVTMMVAMMLPSIAPSLWRYHRGLRALRLPGAGRRTTLFAIGYASVWIAIALALFVMSTLILPFGPWATAAVVLCAGVLQRSPWKAKQLRRCRAACVPNDLGHLWRVGCCFGIDCALSCAAPMAVLFVSGLMDVPMMLLITAAITAERVTPIGERIARFSGTLVVIVGLIVCVRWG